MHIEISTDHNIDGRERLTIGVKGVVEKALNRFNDRITRVDVHLSDAKGKKSGQEDKHCTIEARLEGRQPSVATNQAPTLDLAVSGATAQLKRSLKTILGRESTLHGLRDLH